LTKRYFITDTNRPDIRIVAVVVVPVRVRTVEVPIVRVVGAVLTAGPQVGPGGAQQWTQIVHPDFSGITTRGLRPRL